MRIKKALASIIWGHHFPDIGGQAFKIVQGPLAGKSLSDVETDSFVTKFSVDESSNCFHLEDKFRLSLSSGSEFFVN